MRAVVITKHGGPDVLQVQERPDPALGSGQVRIEVAAAGINFADVMARMGLYPDAPKTPCVVGYEVAGTILEVGDGIAGLTNSLSVGQRVLAGTQFGGYASQVVAGAGDVVALPDELSFEQGAAIPVNYGTAWAGLIGYGNLQPGERVLIHSAGGGVGIAATQIAKRVGVEVYGTASPGKHARIAELGVDHAVDYTKPGWERGLPKFDVIMDAIGGASFRRSYNLLRPGGRLVVFGASSLVSGERKNVVTALRTVARMPRFNLIKQMSESKAVIGLNMLSLWKDRGTLEPWIEPLREMLDDGTVKPVVAEAFTFERAGAAQTMIVERRNVGKVVLTP
jgi:NADPH:quinone reductase-like Zn-dependent oxidoreductase